MQVSIKIMASPNSLVIFILFMMSSCVHSWLVSPLMPSKYILEIKTDLEEESFDGKVIIKVKCEIPTKTISLNALKNKFSIDDSKISVQMEGQDENLAEIGHWGDEVFIIQTKQTLRLGGVYTITVPFNGKLDNGVQDGYYIVKDGDGRYIAANQFSSLKARSGFPCFDETFLKASFKVILHRRKTEYTLSSATVERSEQKKDEPEWMTDEYKPSIALSPALIAYAVTNIPITSTPGCQNLINYWYKKDSTDSEKAGKFACEQTQIQSSTLAEWFNLPPLESSVSKIDVFLHPQFTNSYIGGWGLIFSREAPVYKGLWDIPDKFVTYVRLAFQYFGGIVSYESLQSSLFFKCLIIYLAEFLLENRKDYSFVAENLVTIDASMLTNQFVGEFDPEHYKLKIIYNDVRIPWDSNNYLHFLESRGILAIRMIHYTVGPRVFKQTLRQFYNEYKYRYASETNFWNTLNWNSKPAAENLVMPITSKVPTTSWFTQTSWIPKFYKDSVTQTFSRNGPFSNLPLLVSIKDVMATWHVTDSKGNIHHNYPLIRVKRMNSYTIAISQESFEGNWVRLTEGSGDHDNKRWWIPITYTTASSRNFKQTSPTAWIGPMHGDEGIKLFAITSERDWIIFNIQHVGLYRVMYDSDNWNLIIKALNDKNKFSEIHYLNRLQLVRDALDFGFLGHMTYDNVFRLLQYLQFEDKSVVWTMFFRHIRILETAIHRTEYYDKYQTNMKRILTNLFERTFPNKEWSAVFETPVVNDLQRNDAAFKMLVLTKSMDAGVDDLKSLCQTQFDKWKTEGDIPEYSNGFEKQLITVALSTILSSGNNDDFQFVFNKITESNKNYRKLDIYVEALRYVYNENAMNEIMNWLFSEKSNEILKKKSEFIWSLVHQPKSFSLVLSYIYNNFETVKTNVKDKELLEIIRMLALKMNTSELDQLEEFISKNEELKSNEDIEKILKQGKIGDDRRKKWLEENKESLESGLTAWEFHVKGT